MDAYPLPVRPLPTVLRAAPVVDLRDVEVDDDEFATWEPWAWCMEYTRRFVELTFPKAKRVLGHTIKGFDRTSGADQSQLLRVLDALDDGRPVAFYGWWPTAEAASISTTLGVDVVDVPTPDRKGTALVDGHAVVLVGYARHDAYPGGGYFVVRNSWSAAGWGDEGVGYVPFTYVRAYATALWTAKPELRQPASIDDEPGSPVPTGAEADREIAKKARCADPRASYTPLFFSENAADTLRAKAICSVCSVKALCLSRALERAEPYGVWGGEFLYEGEIVALKRGRGRPSLRPLPAHVDEITGLPIEPETAVA